MGYYNKFIINILRLYKYWEPDDSHNRIYALRIDLAEYPAGHLVKGEYQTPVEYSGWR
jgi:hypothetical protein